MIVYLVEYSNKGYTEVLGIFTSKEVALKYINLDIKEWLGEDYHNTDVSKYIISHYRIIPTEPISE